MFKALIAIILAGCFIVAELNVASKTLVTLDGMQQQQAAAMAQIAQAGVGQIAARNDNRW